MNHRMGRLSTILCVVAVALSACSPGQAAPDVTSATPSSAFPPTVTPLPTTAVVTGSVNEGRVPVIAPSSTAPSAPAGTSQPAQSFPSATATTQPAQSLPAATATNQPAPQPTRIADLKAELYFPGAGGPGDCNLQSSSTSNASIDVKYRQNKPVKVTGNGFDANTQLPLGLYFSKNRNGKTDLVGQEMVKTDGQGNLSASFDLAAPVRKGFYFVIAVVDRKADYDNSGAQKPSFDGAGACFRIK